MKKILLLIVVLLLFAVQISQAADVAVQAQKVQVNGLLGTIGVAGGIYWPVIQVERFGIDLGPMAAVGESTVVGGAGLHIPVAISAPVLENLNFGWAGYGYDWVDRTAGFEFGVGATVEIK